MCEQWLSLKDVHSHVMGFPLWKSTMEIHRLCLEIPCGENGYPRGMSIHALENLDPPLWKPIVEIHRVCLEIPCGTNGYPRGMFIHMLWIFHCENPRWKSIECVREFCVGKIVILHWMGPWSKCGYLIMCFSTQLQSAPVSSSVLLYIPTASSTFALDLSFNPTIVAFSL